MRLLLAAVLAASAPAASAQGPAATALPLNVGGRTIREPGGALRFGWPGVYFEGRFHGTGVRVRFEAPAEHMRLLIDGEERTVFERAGEVDLTFGGLAAGEHIVRLEKMTESQSGGGRFHGFYPVSGARALPAPRRARQIEFIGDSFTVGYGNTSLRRECSAREVHDTTDTQQGFGPLVARRFDADYRINAFSGFGIVRNYAGRERGVSLPAIYPRLKPDEPAGLEAGDPGWRPQIIVINLGTNDFSTPLQPGEPWADQAALRSAYRSAYAGFLRRLAARQPQARFVLMATEPFLAEVEQVASTLAERTTVLRFGQLERSGCDWHPSLADHRRFAAQLEALIRSRPDYWEPARSD